MVGLKQCVIDFPANQNNALLTENNLNQKRGTILCQPNYPNHAILLHGHMGPSMEQPHHSPFYLYIFKTLSIYIIRLHLSIYYVNQ